MANTKKFVAYDTTAKTVYGIIERQVDSYILNDADGAFASNPADPYVSFTEHTVIKGEYVLSESRTAWNDGLYKCTMYEQAGGSPAPVSDMVIAYQYMYIKDDAEVVNESVINTLALESGGNLASALADTNELQSLISSSKLPAQVKGIEDIDFSTTMKASIATSVLTSQAIRDAMKLAPSAGDPAAGSVDKHLDDILEDTGTTLDDKLDTLVLGHTGANTVTITVYIHGGTTPIPEYQIDIWNSAGTVFITSIETGVLGTAQANLDDGTYLLRGRKVGYDADNESETFIVSALLLTKTIYATAVAASTDWTSGEW